MRMSHVVSLHRYPVKSMMGEELNAAEINEFGLVGDRSYAIVDGSDGKVASARESSEMAGYVSLPRQICGNPRV